VQIITDNIHNWWKKNSATCNEKFFFLSPYFTTTGSEYLDQKNLTKIKDKRCVIRFDPTQYSTYCFPAIEILLKVGFKIRFNNMLHTKLFIVDNKWLAGSANLTFGGGEKNIELMIHDEIKSAEMERVFDQIWKNSRNNIINQELLNRNRHVFDSVNKNQEKTNHKSKKQIFSFPILNNWNPDLMLQECEEQLLSSKDDFNWVNKELTTYSNTIKQSFNSNYSKKLLIDESKGFSNQNTLIHKILYGKTSARTGLHHGQVRTAFNNPKIEEVIQIMYPPVYNGKDWQLEDNGQLDTLCNSIFRKDIKQYSTALPMRLVSLFYPNTFFPMFNMHHMKSMCKAFGRDLKGNVGENYFEATVYLKQRTEHIEGSLNFKSHVLYRFLMLYSFFNRRMSGKKDLEIIESISSKWMKDHYFEAIKILDKHQIKFETKTSS